MFRQRVVSQQTLTVCSSQEEKTNLQSCHAHVCDSVAVFAFVFSFQHAGCSKIFL